MQSGGLLDAIASGKKEKFHKNICKYFNYYKEQYNYKYLHYKSSNKISLTSKCPQG